MKLELREYNVTPDIEKRNDFYIRVEDEKIKYNRDVILDKEKISRIFSLLRNYKEDIIKITSEITHNSKGGRQQMMTIQYEDEKPFYLIGNTNREEMSNFYFKLEKEIIDIIKK